MGYWEPDYEPQNHRCDRAIPRHPAGRRGPDRGFGGGGRRVLHRDLDRGVDRQADRLREIPGEMLPGLIRCRMRRGRISRISPTIWTYSNPASIANLSASIIGNVFGFKPLKALRAGRYADAGCIH